MILNWAPEAIVDIIVSVIILIAVILTYFEPKTKKIKSLFYIRLGIFSLGLFFGFDALAILFLSTILARLIAFTVIFAAVFLTIGLNYVLKESYHSIILTIVISYGVLISFLAWVPDSIIIEYEAGYLNVNWHGIFLIIADLYLVLPLLVIFYWGIKTWLNSPFLIKKEANILLIGVFFGCPITLLTYFFYYINPIFILISDVIGAIGVLIFCIAVIREPKLLYILPFTLYRIVVKDRKGYPLFDHDWSESNISEEMFTGFINAVQLMSEEVMNIGGLLDINLQKGILILHDSELITVGLVSSKFSQLLKDSIINFTSDFEQMFKKQLIESCNEPEKYETAYLLIDKHFSNFPFRLISTKKHPLLLSGDHIEIPLELESRLKSIVMDKKELSLIKSEILKAPYGLSEEFLSLYDELKDEIALTSEKETNKLENKIKNKD